MDAASAARLSLSELPERWNYARDVVDRFAGETARPALEYRDASGQDHLYSFAEMSEGIHRFASVLESLSVGAGESLLVLLPPMPEWQFTVVGALAAGVVAIPTSIGALDADELRRRAQHSEAVAIVTLSEHVPLLDALAPELPALRHRMVVREGGEAIGSPWLDLHDAMAAADPACSGRATRLEDPALVFYTSGTSGTPKGVLHSHAYPYAAARQGPLWHGLREHDRFWPTTGFAKAAFVPWACGASIIVTRTRASPARQLELLRDLAPDVFCSPPSDYRAMLQEDLSRLRGLPLRECIAAGEPLNPKVLEAWRDATGLVIRDGYGQSEAGLLVANGPDSPVRPGSMGRALAGYEVEVIDADGAPLAPKQVGDLAVRLPAPGVFIEYWKDPVATAARRRGDWYLTGDRAWRDVDDHIWFVGRSEDVIVSGGEHIGPFEVESRLLEHPDVVETAAVAAPDADLGQVVEAHVVVRNDALRGPALERELLARFASVDPRRQPRRFVFVDELPKTATGKIRRQQLRRTGP
jgi:acetyl-CoA synthetase/medium-chain acyl-CoA synthetase